MSYLCCFIDSFIHTQDVDSAAGLSSRMKGAGGVGGGWQQQGQSTGPPPPPGGLTQIHSHTTGTNFSICKSNKRNTAENLTAICVPTAVRVLPVGGVMLPPVATVAPVTPGVKRNMTREKLDRHNFACLRLVYCVSPPLLLQMPGRLF